MFPQRVLMAAGLVCVLAAAQAAPEGAPALAGQQGTDTPAWRAAHNPLLTVTRAGDRLVAAGDRGTILLSDDQGITWRTSQSGTGELLTASVFSSPAEGWVVGQDSTILHTADAGAHWTTQTTAAGNDQALFSIASLGAGHLIATGAYALILETQDDGATWSPDKLPNLDEDYHLNCVLARGADVVITGEAGHAFVRHGTAWTPMPVGYEGSQFGCLAAHDGSIYSFGLRGSLFVSTPAAPAWRRIETGEQRSIFGGTVLANGFMALVGSTGLVMLFDPQTAKLRTLPPPTGKTLSAVAETASGKWVVVGDDGVHLIDPTAPPPATEKEMTQ